MKPNLWPAALGNPSHQCKTEALESEGLPDENRDLPSPPNH